MGRKIIFHVDMDAFFASCEEAVNPKLKNKPLVVGGTKNDLRSIVCCPNYKARERGIRTAMPIAAAVKLAPDGNFIRSTRGLYSDFSARLRNIFYSFTPAVEPMSVDEAYLDVSGVLHLYDNDAFKLAFIMKEKIKNDLGITCSIGISSNKICSKIASKINKPDGITVIQEGKESEFLSSLPVNTIPGVGKATLKKLNKYRIFFIGDILKYNAEILENIVGVHGKWLLNVANGIDNREVIMYDNYEQKSLSKENTLSFDTYDLSFLEKELYFLLEKACARLRVKKLISKNVTVKVKYFDFTVNQKSFTIGKLSNIEMDFFDVSKKLLQNLLSGKKKIRLLGVKFSELKSEDNFNQERIFINDNKINNLVKKIDLLRKKFSYDVVKFGKTFDI